MTNPKGDDFRRYRDIAPEGVEDDAILNLIKKSDGNHAAITAAIENMWHDLPDEKAVGMRDEWNTTSKSKSKKDAIAAQQALLADRGGRGGRGPQAGGRGQGGRGLAGGRGIGPAPGRGASMARPAAPIHQPTARPAAVAADQLVAQVPAAATSAPTATAPAVSSGSSGWGSGGTTLAEKLKQAEILKLLSPAPVVVEVALVEDEAGAESLAVPAADAAVERGSRRSRGRAAGPPAAAVAEPVIEVEAEAEEVGAVEEQVQELVEEVIELSVAEPVIVEEVVEVPVVPVEAPVVVVEPVVHVVEVPQVAAPTAFLKMGKWEAPESSPFQFGSFGNYSAPSNEDSLSVPAPWGGAVAETEQIQSDAAVWSNSSDISASSSSGPSAMSSLFPVAKGLPSVSSEVPASAVTSSSHIQNGRYDQQKPSAPPGLELSKPLSRQDSRSSAPGQNQSRGKHDASQQQQQQQQPQLQQQQQQYQQPQYQQQAPAATPAASRGQPPSASSMLYGYAPGFEPQYQQPSYGQPAPIAPSAVTDSPVAAAGAAPAQGQGVAQGAPQALQYGPPPGMPNHYVNPYYSSPYYSNPAYFYGQPVLPNPYYGQGRGDYQANRYGSDPYASGGQYPNVYHQGGGFPDQGMPMQHPSMAQQSQVQSGAAAAPGATAGQSKQQKGASAAAAAPQQQDPNQGYGYNHYNPREGQWQQYQGWQAPMMGFPGGSPSAGGPQGFAQPPQQQSGSGQRPSSSGYGGPAGQGQQGQGQQSFSRGPAPNAAGPASGGSASQHW